MHNRNSIKLCLILALQSVLFLGFLNQDQALGSIGPTPQIPQELPSTENSLFLPLIGKGYPTPPPVYGVETLNFAQWKLDKATQANINWIHNSTFTWDTIEPGKPSPSHTYYWDVVDNAGLIDAYNNNLTLIAMIRNTPGWARMPKYGAYKCGPVDATALDDYAQFVYDLVLRYSQPPYNIHYFEFGNEPDIDPVLLGTNYSAIYGCWGDENDAYYGGGYYAEMLKHVYPAVKAASPESQVVIGGLLLFCDPTHVPIGKTCESSNFLEGILRNQGAANFDILSFHGYSAYSQGEIIDETSPWFAARGGQIVGKVDFLRSVMNQYGVNKPVMMTETALCCSGCTTASDTFLQLQADYVVSAYVRSWGLNLLGALWYTLEDSYWQQTGLHYKGESRPGYDALVFLTHELENATIGSQITQYPGLRGYQFTTSTKRIWVLWAPDGKTGQTISLPGNVSQIYDQFGGNVPISDPITILHPVYIELPH